MGSALDRVSLTLPQAMVGQLDTIVEDWGYGSRSEAIRDALREFFAQYRWETDDASPLRGSIVISHAHHVNGLPEQLLQAQHDYHDLILSSQHVHLDQSRCIETLIVDGPGEDIRSLENKLRSLRGVRQVELAIVTD